jgi:hypothetical protein
MESVCISYLSLFRTFVHDKLKPFPENRRKILQYLPYREIIQREGTPMLE